MIGFFIAIFVFISIFAGTSYYLTHRIYHGLISLFPNLQFWPMLLIFFTLAVTMALGFGRSMLPLSKEVKQILGIISSYYMGIFIYLLLFTAALDLLLLVLRLLNISFITHPHIKGMLTLGMLALTGITCIYGFFHARQISHISYEIQLQNKADISDLNMVMISDLHLGAVGSESQLETIVSELNTLNPDIVCIAGDFFDTDYDSIQDPEAALKILKDIRSTYGVYACLGNHDAGQTVNQMREFLEQADIQVLNDAYTIIDDRLILAGRLDSSPIGGYGTQKRKEFSQFFVRENSFLPVIVMDHNPMNIHEYSTDADLILCGHTHKGQLFPANLITNAIFTVDYGYYQKDTHSPHVIVTSGVGSWGMPMRVGTNCEIVTIRFSQGN